MGEFVVYTNGNRYIKTAEELKEFSPENFDLFIDLPRRICLEKDKGAVRIFSKRVLGKLLCFFIVKSPDKYMAFELYESVWGMRADWYTAETSVKTSISRLRKLVEPNEQEWKYICKTEPSFWDGKKGEYYFNQQCKYCLIIPESLCLFEG